MLNHQRLRYIEVHYECRCTPSTENPDAREDLVALSTRRVYGPSDSGALGYRQFQPGNLVYCFFFGGGEIIIGNGTAVISILVKAHLSKLRVNNPVASNFLIFFMK